MSTRRGQAPRHPAALPTPAARKGRVSTGASMWCALATFAAVAFVACGDGAGTQLGSPPATLVAVSMPVDTVVTGEQTDPPVSVRVEDALGGAVEGTPVRFVLLNGEGNLSPGVAVSGRDGVAESQFRASASPGIATVRPTYRAHRTWRRWSSP